MLDVAGNILWVHYTSMKCDVSLLKSSISTLFRWGGHFSCVCKKFLPAYNSAKIIKIDRFSRVMITNVLPPFFESQCTHNAQWPYYVAILNGDLYTTHMKKI